MTDTLTQIIAKVQAQFIDDGTRFNTATCTAAIRAALAKLNERLPIYTDTEIAAVANQNEYDLTAADSTAIAIIDIMLMDTNGENHTSLKHASYTRGENLYFRLHTPTTGTILASYAKFHTIDGLDSADTSTLPAALDQILVDGACAEALAIRAASRVETINLQKDVSPTYEAMGHFRRAFELGITNAAARRGIPKSAPRSYSWNDEWHGW